MTYTVIFKPAAEAEAGDAYAWYEEQSERLGEAFKQGLDEVVASIQQHPEMYPVVYKDFRRALMSRRFPYEIFYSIETDRIIVHAVFHAKRDPQEWQDRA